MFRYAEARAESLRERSSGVLQVRVSLSRDPKTKRYRYVSTTIRGGRRAARREAARLVREANEGKIPLERETLASLLERWLAHIEARGRAPKTLLENLRLATVMAEDLGPNELRRLQGRDLDGFYDSLRKRGLFVRRSLVSNRPPCTAVSSHASQVSYSW